MHYYVLLLDCQPITKTSAKPHSHQRIRVRSPHAAHELAVALIAAGRRCGRIAGRRPESVHHGLQLLCAILVRGLVQVDGGALRQRHQLRVAGGHAAGAEEAPIAGVARRDGDVLRVVAEDVQDGEELVAEQTRRCM